MNVKINKNVFSNSQKLKTDSKRMSLFKWLEPFKKKRTFISNQSLCQWSLIILPLLSRDFDQEVSDKDFEVSLKVYFI